MQNIFIPSSFDWEIQYPVHHVVIDLRGAIKFWEAYVSKPKPNLNSFKGYSDNCDLVSLLQWETFPFSGALSRQLQITIGT